MVMTKYTLHNFTFNIHKKINIQNKKLMK